MKPLILAVFVLVLGGVSAQQSAWQPSPGHTQVPIWPGAVPDQQAVAGPEVAKTTGKEFLVAGRPAVGVSSECKPDCEGAYTVLARTYFSSGQYQGVAALVDRALPASGDDYNIYIPITNSLEELGQKELAKMMRERGIRALEKQLDTVPEDVRARMLLAGYYAAVGRREDAVRQLQTAVALRPRDSNVLCNAASTYALLQQAGEALEMLRAAKDAGWANLDWALREPDLISLRDDPEFQCLCREGASKG